MLDTLCLFVLPFCLLALFVVIYRHHRLPSAPAEERAKLEQQRRAFEMELNYGRLNPALFCTHCQAKGYVRTHRTEQKMGISGGKATAALLTGGASLLVAGLSRKQSFTAAYCENCNSNWLF